MPADPAPPAGGWRIRRLGAADAAIYRPLRLEALRLHPAAFSSDLAEESRMDETAFAARMPAPPGGLFGAFISDGANERLAGIAGLVVQPRAKLRHKGLLVGMYVMPDARRAGLGRALVQHVIAEARRARLRVLQLGVTVGNEHARRLYRDFGFRRYGVEPAALWVDGVFHDEELMALRLD